LPSRRHTSNFGLAGRPRHAAAGRDTRQIHVRQATLSKLEAGKPATQLRILMYTLAARDLELVIRPHSKASPDDIEEGFQWLDDRVHRSTFI
jgi:HTH-type transcriptional regulator/antitoxin HipB